ncbi:hypothetical protein PtA15_16A153 [Puccinia triticina]|uniref:Tet-like 2OG-Fe(II) oxygenase domain-containing protein n=1 Tax=Puccinia triticina TaxID=208348 RepID=A0ABY7DBC6_9BASI|nr:uncharacterized protein PtA15_16A153 [Puccinia triticina]WAQ92247.1 hypothetical protein PtA15_16A153 [Puccinia triticina]
MGSQILFLAQFHNLEDDNPVVNALWQVVKDLHLMGKNQYPIKPATMLSGTMKGIGFRPGMEHDKTAAFENNAALMKTFGLPSWSDSEWTDFLNDSTQAFTSAIVTNNDFTNEPHPDDDVNGFTYGIFTYINPKTGDPITPNISESSSGHALRFPEFNCKIDFGMSPGIIEIAWASNRVIHHTTKPPKSLQTTKFLTHFGSSLQTAKALIYWAQMLAELPLERKLKQQLDAVKETELKIVGC